MYLERLLIFIGVFEVNKTTTKKQRKEKFDLISVFKGFLFSSLFCLTMLILKTCVLVYHKSLRI